MVYVAYPLLVKTKGKLDFFKYIFLRWIRFTPSLAGLLMIHMIWPLMGSGPVFREKSQKLLKPCYESWWKNFVYINNWADKPDDIVSHSHLNFIQTQHHSSRSDYRKMQLRASGGERVREREREKEKERKRKRERERL